MLLRLALLSLFAGSLSAYATDEPAVHVQQPHLQGPRELQETTAKAVVQNYLDSWQSMNKALDQNRPDLLDRDFVGSAKDKLAATIKQQRPPEFAPPTTTALTTFRSSSIRQKGSPFSWPMMSSTTCNCRVAANRWEHSR